MNVIELGKSRNAVNRRSDNPSMPFLSVGGKAFVYRLPSAEGRVILEAEGGTDADLFLGGQYIGSVGRMRSLIDISGAGSDELEIVGDEQSNPRSVRLHTSFSDVNILPYGVFVSTRAIKGECAELDVAAEVKNLGEKRRLTVDVEIYYKSRRVSRKRKTYVFAAGDRTVVLPVRIRRANLYRPTRPQLYSAIVRLIDEDGNIADISKTRFGVCAYDSYAVGDKSVGCTLACDNSVWGGRTAKDAELRKMAALRDLGYNTVRYIGCPSDAALLVADELGFRVIVDLFDNWTNPRGNRDHVTFAARRDETVAASVRFLRNHPSVVMYSIGNMPEESYGRSGIEHEKAIIDGIRRLDASRPVTAAVGELVPLKSELRAAGANGRAVAACRDNAALTSLGREHNVFAKATEDFLRPLDVITVTGDCLPQLQTEKPIIVISESPGDSLRDIAVMQQTPAVLGDVSAFGTDVFVHGVYRTGDLNATGLPRAAGLYRSVLLGNPISFMTVSAVGQDALDGEMQWRDTGAEKVCVNVFTAGDVVALYLNGRILGRKMAGKANGYCATFETEYRAGTLEAVCYRRGQELCRTTLETTGEAKRIRLMTGSHRIGIADGDLAFFDIWLLDANGRIAQTRAELNVSVEGGGEIVAVGDEYGQSPSEDSIKTEDGHALVVVRGTKVGNLTVHVTGDGLRRGRLSVKVRE